MCKKRLAEISKDPGRGGCGILAIADLKGESSHDLLQDALRGLKRMEHRGGSLDGTGDGAGLLFKPERNFFERFIKAGKNIPSKKEPLIVGTVFFLHGERNIPQLQRKMDLILRRDGLMPLGWRKIPVDEKVQGVRALDDIPEIYQLLAAKGHRREAQLFEALHGAKITIERELPGMVNVVSLEPYTTVYKALCTSDQLARFYKDFADSDFETSVLIAHRRFSTNTFSNWNLVQPFRHIAHNGEINTITSNCRAIRDADCALRLPNTLMKFGSDSAQVDRVAEMMVANGMSGLEEALRRMIPPAWTEDTSNEEERTFFEANRRALGTIGAWEGPIAIVCTDGKILTAILDRMGLRPLRYMLTKSGRLIISSEIGAVPRDQSDIAEDGQLEPGGMIAADLITGKFIAPNASTAWIMDRTRMDFQNLSTVNLIPMGKGRKGEPLSIKTLNTFGWTRDRVSLLHQTIKAAKEPVLGMGNDLPLAIFSENNSRLYSHLHQIVAVVTNPPIDPIREGGAIDTTVYLGRSPRLTKRSNYKSYPQYELEHPILTNEQMEALLSSETPELKTYELDATFEDNGKPRTMVRRIHSLIDEALSAIRSKKGTILVISDYRATMNNRLPLPMLLVVSAIHRALAEAGLRRDSSIVVETGEVHESHDCAILLAYGATAINPYAMFHLADETAGMTAEEAERNLTSAIVANLKRVMSKMGITTIAGYRGSALFEAIGISSDVVEYFIPDTVSRLGGITMNHIYADAVARSHKSADELEHNRNISIYRKEVTDALQLVARNGNAVGDYDRFLQLLEDTPPIYLRDMLDFVSQTKKADINAVAKPAEIIREMFSAAGMSHGALNALAHRAIAAAFNHFGAKSCSGEGGEDDRRDRGAQWEKDRSRIRQIASGRFGVDARYLVNADEIEIKIGQGAKPGEGGHLPGQKVTAEIARIRKTKEGIDLISPPPHHDIYSIEDLAQLITNLRQLHPNAVVSVKVPSITGLGTIAVGITKAGADVIVISCFSGGTGAASSGSIAHAGLPLERGVSEVHQYLVTNGIRSKIRIRADGGIKSGLDTAKVVALGTDEVAVGTPLLIAECCVYCRGCNKGNCPVGIATQDQEKLDQRFMRRFANEERYEEAKNGVIRYLECLAEHFRNILARLGLRDPKDLIGRVDLLKQIESHSFRWDSLDLSELLIDCTGTEAIKRSDKARAPVHVSDKNRLIVEKAQDVLDEKTDQIYITLELTNDDHAVGATLAGTIAQKGGLAGNKIIQINTTGFSGQGFAFGATSGMRLRHQGYANDGVAEIISGSAQVVIVPPTGTDSETNPHLVGNAAAYGATGGTLFVAGRAGQRFGVRNSGATLVCEGVGKYSFEYMTGGIGVVLGRCGPCIGSGMTGGELFIYDPDGSSAARLHPDVKMERMSDEAERVLKNILENYYEETKSHNERDIRNFIHVMPR